MLHLILGNMRKYMIRLPCTQDVVHFIIYYFLFYLLYECAMITCYIWAKHQDMDRKKLIRKCHKDVLYLDLELQDMDRKKLIWECHEEVLHFSWQLQDMDRKSLGESAMKTKTQSALEIQYRRPSLRRWHLTVWVHVSQIVRITRYYHLEPIASCLGSRSTIKFKGIYTKWWTKECYFPALFQDNTPSLTFFNKR